MQAPIRKVVVFAGAAAIATGVGVGVASRGDDSAAATPTAISPGAGQGRFGPPAGDRSGARSLADLADALGVTEQELRAALDDALPQPGFAPAPRDPRSLAAALAAELGLTTQQVEEALDELRPDGDHDGGTAPDTTTTGTVLS